MEWKKIQKTLVDFIHHPTVEYATVIFVIAGDCLTLANLLPKHSLYTSRPYHGWEKNDKMEALTGNPEDKMVKQSVQTVELVQN
ncbi:uncharacterized protein Dwil_GK27703 [Drosophila willistoni]|uniref:Uncharacterized protein n=1 Tax=Drosophila willistoni TaxID=7260 RepID=A0A0Q9WP07_DROWI|nr:uncharacterized protein Dwil_GK27703 [Drosophila willistoni]